MAKTILITGASTGIGRATAKYFQEKGWNVVATMRTPEKETELTQLDNVLVNKIDVTDKTTIKNAVSEAINKFGKIDVLLNNAGYGAIGLLEAASDESIKRQFDVNMFGLLDVTREILPHFRKNKDGIIINVTSVGGRMTFPLVSLYHGTKFAVEGISESLSYELSAIGCKVKIIEPGAIATDFATRSLDFFNDESLDEYQPLVKKIQNFTETVGEHASDPIVVAKVIYEAATDGTDKLRYPAGDDAIEQMANRSKLDDEMIMNGIKERFGLRK